MSANYTLWNPPFIRTNTHSVSHIIFIFYKPPGQKIKRTKIFHCISKVLTSFHLFDIKTILFRVILTNSNNLPLHSSVCTEKQGERGPRKRHVPSFLMKQRTGPCHNMRHKKVLFLKEIPMQIEFLCGSKPIFWHEPTGEDMSTGCLNESNYHREGFGVLIFEQDKSYPAFYLYDSSDPCLFWLVAISRNTREAFRIRREQVPRNAIIGFIREYHPKRMSEIKGCTLKN